MGVLSIREGSGVGLSGGGLCSCGGKRLSWNARERGSLGGLQLDQLGLAVATSSIDQGLGGSSDIEEALDVPRTIGVTALAVGSQVTPGIFDVLVGDAMGPEVEVGCVFLVYLNVVVFLVEAFMVFLCHDFGWVILVGLMFLGSPSSVLFWGEVFWVVNLSSVPILFVPGIEMVSIVVVLEVLEVTSKFVDLSC